MTGVIIVAIAWTLIVPFWLGWHYGAMTGRDALVMLAGSTTTGLWVLVAVRAGL